MPNDCILPGSRKLLQKPSNLTSESSPLQSAMRGCYHCCVQPTEGAASDLSASLRRSVSLGRFASLPGLASLRPFPSLFPPEPPRGFASAPDLVSVPFLASAPDLASGPAVLALLGLNSAASARSSFLLWLALEESAFVAASPATRDKRGIQIMPQAWLMQDLLPAACVIRRCATQQRTARFSFLAAFI